MMAIQFYGNIQSFRRSFALFNCNIFNPIFYFHRPSSFHRNVSGMIAFFAVFVQVCLCLWMCVSTSACRELQILVSACALCILFVHASRLWFVFTSVAKHTVLHMFASLHHTCVFVCEKRGLTLGHWLLSRLPAAVCCWEFSFLWVFICVDCEHHYELLWVAFAVVFWMVQAKRCVCVCVRVPETETV